MMKSGEKAQNPGFLAHFWHFRPEMNFFRKSGSITFLAFAILYLCAKNQEKLMS